MNRLYIKVRVSRHAQYRGISGKALQLSKTITVEGYMQSPITNNPTNQAPKDLQQYNQKPLAETSCFWHVYNSCGHKFMSVAFAFGLGTTHPCAIAVHMEPFSTSALKDLT